MLFIMNKKWIWQKSYEWNLFGACYECLNDVGDQKIIYLVCLICVKTNKIILVSNLILLFLFYFHIYRTITERETQNTTKN